HSGRGSGTDLGVALPAELRRHQRFAAQGRLDAGPRRVALLARSRDGRGHLHQRVARHPVLHDHAAGGAAGDPRRALRSGARRRRRRGEPLLAHHRSAAPPHYRGGDGDPHHLDVQLRRSDFRHDRRRAGERHADHLHLHLDAGLLGARFRLRRGALGGAAAGYARVHRRLSEDNPRRRGDRMTPRRASGDLAERILRGPVLWGGLIVLTLFALGPFIWMLLTSLKDRQELYAHPLQYLPVHPTFENYVEAWTSPVTPFSRFFFNSLWVCSVTMVATTAVSVLAGYAIARFRFAGRDALLLIFLATQMFPSVLLIAPLLTQWRALGLIDSYQALIYSNFSFTVPFTVWMMVGYFSSIPRDLEESAMIDGCNHFGALCRIVLPLAAPGIAATAIFAFVVSWSELLFAISFTTQ